MREKPLKGYFGIDNEKVYFSYDNKILSIFPNELMNTEDVLKAHIDQIKDALNPQKDEGFIHKKQLTGTLFSGNQITFLVLDDMYVNEGMYDYDVVLYIVHDFNFADPELRIDISISSSELDKFYPSYRIFGFSLNAGDNGRDSKQVNISNVIPTRIEGILLENALINWHFSIHYSFRAKNPIPLEASTILRIELLDAPSLNLIIESVYGFARFMKFVSNRRNISIESIQLTTTSKDANSERSGYLVIFDFDKPETNLKSKQRILEYTLLTSSPQTIQNLIQYSYSSKYTEMHINENYESSKRIDQSRIMNLYMSFEKEFTRIYGERFIPSEDYMAVVKTLVECIDGLSKSKDMNSKKRKKLSGFKEIIEGDKALVERMLFAYDNNVKIMNLYASYLFKGKHIDERLLCANISGFRNIIAHGDSLDNKVEDYYGIQLLEIMIYSMILRDCGLDDKAINQGVNNLFGFHVEMT